MIADLVARRVEHLEVIERFELGADVQGDRQHRAGRRGIARLLQGQGQGTAGHAPEVVEHGAGLARVDGRADATAQADFVLASGAGGEGVERGEQGQTKQQRFKDSHARPRRETHGRH
ncbi:hypothetical protein D9M71_801750 [compost metagenome]